MAKPYSSQPPIGPEVWLDIVGERIAQLTEPLEITKGALSVRVDIPMWQEELKLMAAEILPKVQMTLPRLGIKRIRWM